MQLEPANLSIGRTSEICLTCCFSVSGSGSGLDVAQRRSEIGVSPIGTAVRDLSQPSTRKRKRLQGGRIERRDGNRRNCNDTICSFVDCGHLPVRVNPIEVVLARQLEQS
jgi:hypothetical protein